MLDPALKMRMDRIQEKVSLLDLALSHYSIKGKHARDGMQVSCPFHSKNGRHDQIPSAHIYESSNKFWCFTCNDLLNVTTFVSKKESVSLARAMSLIEFWYKLPALDMLPELMTVPIIRKVQADLSTQDLIHVIERMLRQLSPCLSFAQYERAFTAWWLFKNDSNPKQDQCKALLDRLLQIRDEEFLK